MKPGRQEITLTDRLSFAFFGAVSSFLTGVLIYALAAYFITSFNNDGVPSFYPVYVFTASMSALGFITANDYIFKILAALWRFLSKVGQGWIP
jgi:hypothetical protein